MKRLIVMKGASQEEINLVKEALENKDLVIIGGELQVYAIKDDEIFEIVNDLKKIGKIEVEE